jgi:hypothetical protein
MNVGGIDIRSEEWRSLWLLLAAYLNPDYDLDYADWQSAVRACARETSRQDVRSAIHGISRLLEDLGDERNLELAMDHFGLDGYCPVAHGLTYREWLTQVSSILGEEGEAKDD